jgi:anti-sigma B factor antagonist
MDFTVEQLDQGIKKISLRGRMDITVTDQMALRLSKEISIEKMNVIVDLTMLDFLASLGIGILVKNYKVLKLRGGNMVFLNPQNVVELVLKTTQVDTLIPICHDLKEARKRVLHPNPKE